MNLVKLEEQPTFMRLKKRTGQQPAKAKQKQDNRRNFKAIRQLKRSEQV